MSRGWDLTHASFLSETEVEALLSFLRVRSEDDDHGGRVTSGLDRVIVESLLLSGLRNSEFCDLSLGDADLDAVAPTFKVRRSDRRSRTVHLPHELGTLLSDYLRNCRPACLPEQVDASDPSQPLLFSERGRPFERTSLYRRVVKILKRAGLGAKASVQVLRHTYGYLAYRRTGGNLLFVQRQLGHSHPRITSVYAQFVEELYAELADRVGGSASRESRETQSIRPCPPPAFDCALD